MVHISVAIGRFFEILLLDIARSLAGVIVAAIVAIAIAVCIGRWLWRSRSGRPDDR